MDVSQNHSAPERKNKDSFLLISIGTRGDMEPFLAIGQILKENGHEITCLFPEQFRSLAEDSGFAFESLGTEFMEMLESDLGKFALGGGGSQLRKIPAFVKLAKVQTGNNKVMARMQLDTVSRLKPDRIVHNGKALYAALWEIDNPGKTVLISPVPYLHYVKKHTHTAFHSNYGELLNRLTYKLADWGTAKAILSLAKWLSIPNVSKKQVQKVLKDHKIIYTISPQLFERPGYWPENMDVLGYHERDKTTNWQPEPGLLSFLDRHPKAICVTFGSMTNPNPTEKTRILLDILRRNKIPAVINTSSGGLLRPESYDAELFHFVSYIPYEWLFPRMYGVIHHGGSGTTHMAAKYGCVSLIVPHIIDQFVWNEITCEKGLGPKGIKIGKITVKNLEPKIADLFTNEQYKNNALEISRKMEQEQALRAELYNELTN